MRVALPARLPVDASVKSFRDSPATRRQTLRCHAQLTPSTRCEFSSTSLARNRGHPPTGTTPLDHLGTIRFRVPHGGESRSKETRGVLNRGRRHAFGPRRRRPKRCDLESRPLQRLNRSPDRAPVRGSRPTPCRSHAAVGASPSTRCRDRASLRASRPSETAAALPFDHSTTSPAFPSVTPSGPPARRARWRSVCAVPAHPPPNPPPLSPRPRRITSNPHDPRSCPIHPLPRPIHPRSCSRHPSAFPRPPLSDLTPPPASVSSHVPSPSHPLASPGDPRPCLDCSCSS